MTDRAKTTDPARPLLLNCLGPAWLAFALALAGGCNGSSTPPSGQPPSGGQEDPATQPPTTAADQTATARAVLEAMAGVYRRASGYADAGVVNLRVEPDPSQISGPANFSVTLVRPNRIRMEAYQAMVVGDAEQLHAAIQYVPGQVVIQKAPPEITLELLFSDRLLAEAIGGGFAGPPPQLMLLLDDDPLAALLQDVQQTALLEPGTIDNRECYRVQLQRADGTAVFWIDRQSYLLRRVEFPTDAMRQVIEKETGNRPQRVSLEANFDGARLATEVDPKAFQFEVPPDAELVKFFVPPNPAQLLGKKVPGFTFFDLGGNPVTSESLAGRITVLDVWATWCQPCRTSLPELEKVYQTYKDRVGFLAVSVDRPETEDQALQDTFEELGVHVPILRDRQQNVAPVLRSQNIPAAFILDAAGVVQDYEVGLNPKLATALPEKLDRLLALEDIYEEPLRAYRQWLKEEEQRRASVPSQSSEGIVLDEQEIPYAKIVPRVDPQTFKFSPLWKCTELKAPGNILVVPQPTGPPRLLVVDALKSVAEVGPDGKLIADHTLGIDQTEVISTLRTAVAADGSRYFVAFALLFAQQRFHLLDEKLNRLLSYPEDALENRHSGIADVALADLDGDGTPQVYVGYWGVVGAEAVSLEGKRIWLNRSLSNVMRLAAAGPDAQGHRSLLCVNKTGSLAVIDAQGRRQGDLTVPNRALHSVVSAQLESGAPLHWCGLTAAKMGKNVAIGLDLTGKELWSYTLPDGVHPQPIERIVSGTLTPGGQGRWLLPAPDGSIHVLAADGKPVDRFAFGVAPAGLAPAELDGGAVLIVSSANGLEAWKVQ